MMDRLDRQFRAALAHYDASLLEETARRASRFATSKRKLPPVECLVQSLGSPRALQRLIDGLDPGEQRALDLLCRCPSVVCRFDHAMAYLQAAGVEIPYLALQGLLREGLLFLQPSGSGDVVSRFEVAGDLPLAGMPTVGLAPPLLERARTAEMPLTPLEADEQTGLRWQVSDGWEWPLRLAVLWRLARRMPIKRTQQNQLFKRDYDRITGDPLLNAPLADAPVAVRQLGIFVYALALAQGWLSVRDDEQSPTVSLDVEWPGELDSLLLLCARDLLTIEIWNELDDSTGGGSERFFGSTEEFGRHLPSARRLVLAWLSTLAADHGATIANIADRLLLVHPPWNNPAEHLGALRNEAERVAMCHRWVELFLLGPLYQTGLIAVAHVGSKTLVRLSALGRRFVCGNEETEERPSFPRTLLVQPNFDVIVYRQGLSVSLLCEMIKFAEPKNLGAALTFELTADSVYHGMESGLAEAEIVRLLETHSGREIPSGVIEAVRHWGQKRDRLTVYSQASLFEFADERDLQEAVARGLNGIPITDKILLVAGEEGTLSHLRITASRDYHLPPEQCVEPGDDGVTLKVDLSRSDLMLEAELRRFAEPVPFRDRNGRPLYRVTPESLAQAHDQGMRLAMIEEWFHQRTGQPLPASVALLCRAREGMTLHAGRQLVVTVERPAVADGLLQHPRSRDFIAHRLGPSSLSIPEARAKEFAAALAELGIDLRIDESP